MRNPIREKKIFLAKKNTYGRMLEFENKKHAISGVKTKLNDVTRMRHCYVVTLILRLQAVPFWLVERSREKTGATNARRGAGGEARKRGKEMSFPPFPQSLLVYFSSLQSRCAVSAPSRLNRKGLLAV